MKLHRAPHLSRSMYVLTAVFAGKRSPLRRIDLILHRSVSYYGSNVRVSCIYDDVLTQSGRLRPYELSPAVVSLYEGAKRTGPLRVSKMTSWRTRCREFDFPAGDLFASRSTPLGLHQYSCAFERPMLETENLREHQGRITQAIMPKASSREKLRACTNCSRAKAKCVQVDNDNDTCQRLVFHSACSTQ